MFSFFKSKKIQKKSLKAKHSKLMSQIPSNKMQLVLQIDSDRGLHVPDKT